MDQPDFLRGLSTPSSLASSGAERPGDLCDSTPVRILNISRIREDLAECQILLNHVVALLPPTDGLHAVLLISSTSTPPDLSLSTLSSPTSPSRGLVSTSTTCMDVIDLTRDDAEQGPSRPASPTVRDGDNRDNAAMVLDGGQHPSRRRMPGVLSAFSLILMLLTTALAMDPNMTQPFIEPHHSRLEMDTIGQVIFSNTHAILHLEFDAYGLYQQIQETLATFHNSTHLFDRLQDSELPLLQNLLYQEFHAVSQANQEYRITLDLISEQARPRRDARSIPLLNLGLSVLNAGWSTYLTVQALHSSSKTNRLVHSVGQLQRVVRLQQKQTSKLAQSIFQLQETTATLTNAISALQLLQGLKYQIRTTTKELHAGIHQHKIPVSLFHPSDIHHSWIEFESFLKTLQLNPVFQDRPSQVYEFETDYFKINDTIHLLTKIPVFDIQQTVYNLQRPKPALIQIKNTLVSYEDPDYIAISRSPVSNPIPVSITSTELQQCNKLGTTFCCPKQIFPHKRTSCADELISGLPYPSETCLKKFKVLDPSIAHVTIRSLNQFDIYTPYDDMVRFACQDRKTMTFPINHLHEINLPPRCTASTKNFKLISNLEVDQAPSLHMDIRQTIQMADWLLNIPHSSQAFERSKNTLLQIMASTPKTLQELMQPPSVDTHINWGLTVAFITLTSCTVTFFIAACIYFKCKILNNLNPAPSTAHPPQQADERTLAARLLNPQF